MLKILAHESILISFVLGNKSGSLDSNHFVHLLKIKLMKNNHINYIELKARDLEAVKEFYGKAFGWTFTDYGPDYVAFADAGLDGGFERSDAPVTNGALVILYHDNLEAAKEEVIRSGGKISADIFSFPGGRRFHFIDPAGNELAVWSDK